MCVFQQAIVGFFYTADEVTHFQSQLYWHGDYTLNWIFLYSAARKTMYIVYTVRNRSMCFWYGPYTWMYRSLLIHTIWEVYSFRTSPYSLELYPYDVHFYIYVCKCEIYVQFRNKYRLIDWRQVNSRPSYSIQRETARLGQSDLLIHRDVHFVPPAIRVVDWSLDGADLHLTEC